MLFLQFSINFSLKTTQKNMEKCKKILKNAGQSKIKNEGQSNRQHQVHQKNVKNVFFFTPPWHPLCACLHILWLTLTPHLAIYFGSLTYLAC